MKRLLFNFILILALLQLSSCNAQSCKDLPAKFSSYKEAITEVKSANFIISENINTSKSTWIKDASFYSCDSKTGFLILMIRSTKYIHQNVPISVWENFKEADSFGRYYNSNIKGRYLLQTRS